MIVISDSSVLIGLSSVDQLHLLKELLNDEICIPGAVWHEVVETRLHCLEFQADAAVQFGMKLLKQVQGDRAQNVLNPLTGLQ